VNLSPHIAKSACGRYIYHISIIDYLQHYDLNKQTERFAKTILLKLTNSDFKPEHISSIEPAAYKQRFMQFVKKVVFRNFR
jgi:hypothetical protein